MPEYISEITDAQRAQFPHQVEKWTKIGLSTERFKWREAIEAGLNCYRAANLKLPTKIVLSKSPIGLVYGCPMLDGLDELPKNTGKTATLSDTFWTTDSAADDAAFRDKYMKNPDDLRLLVRDSVWCDVPTEAGKYKWRGLHDDIKTFATPKDLQEVLKTRNTWAGQSFYNLSFGQFSAAYVSFVDTFEKILGWEHECLKNHQFNRILTETCGFAWIGENVMGISDRPLRISRDNGQQLHHDSDYAIVYRDGFGIASWHGYTIPRAKEWIVREEGKINADVIENESNAEVRRIMLEKYGFENYIKERNAKEISKDVDGRGNTRRLLEFTLKGDTVRVVEVQNGSLEPDGTRRKFILGAARHPGNRNMPKTPKEAVAWSYGLPAEHYDDSIRT